MIEGNETLCKVVSFLHIESLREQSSVSLLAQRSAVGLITALVLLVTAGAVVRNYTKYDTLSLPVPPKERAVLSDTPENPEDEPAVVQALRCWNVSDYAAAEPLLKQALTDAESETAKTSYPGSAAINLRLGMLSYECGRYADAMQYLDTAKEGFLSTLSEDAPEVLLTDGQRALCEISTGEEKQGLERLDALRSVAESADSPADRIDACNLLARGCVLTEQTAEAVGWYEMLLKTAEETREEQAYLNDYRAKYAELLLTDGQKEKAAEICGSALSEKNGAPSPHYRTVFNLLLARASGDAAAAEEAVKAADAAYREETHTGQEDAEYALGLVKARLAHGDYDKAAEAAESAVSAASGSDLESACSEQLGLVHEQSGKLDKALTAYEKALTLSRQQKDDAQTAACLADLCRVCRLQGDFGRSIETGLEADKLLWDIYGKYTAKRIPLLSEMAQSYGAQYKLGLALKYANAVRQIVEAQQTDRKANLLGNLIFGRVRTLEISGRNAMSYVQPASEKADSQYGKTHPESVKAQIWLAEAGMRCRAFEEAAAAYGEAAERLRQAGASEETVSDLLRVQTAISGMRGFLAERNERLKTELASWDGT